MVPQPLPKAPTHPLVKRGVYAYIMTRVNGIRMPVPTLKEFLQNSTSRATVARMLILAKEKK